MTYSETLEYLFTRLPMYQRVGKTAYKKNLTNTVRLMAYLGNPHTKFKSVHIAGTNGKGSSAHGIAATLQSAGYKTGLYTSPHLKNFTERIRINGQEIPEAFIIDFVSNIKDVVNKINPSFFEITVAMAFDYFSKEEVDIAIIETGLGGRLDSTNVITPEVSLITNIGLDHMDILGHTLPEIAREKAGIIKQKVPIVIGEIQKEIFPIFQEVALCIGAKLIVAQQSEWKPEKLTPRYLLKNYSGIKAIIEELKNQGWHIEDKHLKKGMACISELTGFKGRLQVLNKNPMIIADVSHNADGLRILFEQIIALCRGTIHLVFGTIKDKPLRSIFELIPYKSKIYWTQSTVPKALAVEDLALQGRIYKKEGECFKNVNDAIKQAEKKVLPNDLILITGSTFVVAEIDDL